MIFSLFIVSVLSDCITNLYFTECSNSMNRKAIVSKLGDCKEIVNVYDNLSCNFECSSGYYLGISNGQQVCFPCEKGSFNVGGGIIYGNEGIKFQDSIKEFRISCWVIENGRIYYEKCTGWDVINNIIRSGSSIENKEYTTQLRLNVNLVKKGSATIVYKKESALRNGENVGKFSIELDRVSMLSDDDPNENAWIHYKIPLEVGPHELFFYFSTQSGLKINLYAYISSIIIEGTAYAALNCYQCLLSELSKTSGNCDMCDFNEYYDDNQCKKCPLNTYSYIGSKEISSCKIREECTANDYKQTYSPCINHLRNMTYSWKNPLFCNYLNATLPDDIVSVPCENCKPGHYLIEESGVSICKACPNGYYIENYLIENKCKPCNNGTFSYKTFNYSDWTDISSNFYTYCSLNDGSYCKNSNGWIPSIFYLSSGKQLETNSEIYLIKTFNILSSLGNLEFTFEIIDYNQGSIDIYVDDIWKNGYQGKGKGIRKSIISLNQGNHTVKWKYNPNTVSFEEIRIYTIQISGSDEGGASKCHSCPKGFISNNASTSCQACPKGQASSKNNLSCIPCLEFTYNEIEGDECKRCPNGTVHNTNHTACLGVKYMPINSITYYLQKISGISDKEGTYSNGICNTHTLHSYCYQTFYGPIPSKENYFYISILNPSTLSLPEYSYFFEPSLSGSINQECNNQNTIVSLGKIVSNILITTTGFKIFYDKGDICNINGDTFKMNIDMICDKNSGDGWPSFKSLDGCNYNFVWITRYACKMCKFNELITVSSECNNGKRNIVKIENTDCIYPLSSYSMHWEESCSQFYEYISSTPIKIGLIIVFILIILGIITTACYYRQRNLYQKLDTTDN